MTMLDLFPDETIPRAPRGEAELVAWLRLIRSYRVGVTTFLRLMREHGDAAAALDALPRIAATAGVARYAVHPEADARRELDTGRRMGARPVPLGDPEYPALLARIPDPPPLIWVRGALKPPAESSVAIAGARNASALGVRMAGWLAEGVGKAGFVTVSGLARGIDTAVHEASLESGTIAVLAGGVDTIYPPQNSALGDRIAATGLLISEAPIGMRAQARHFPRRNRIISGLAPGIVVVEGAAKSGSLITARLAAEQGREVMAVPGHPFDGRAAGCNMLLRDGATLVRGADDVIAALGRSAGEAGVPAPPADAVPEAAAPDLEAVLMNSLGTCPISEDSLIRALRLPTAEVLSALARLDLEGRIERHAGGLVSVLN